MATSRRAGLGFILVTLFLDILGIGLIVPILPRLLESFVGNDPVLGARYVGVLASAYALMQFIFSPILGSLSDRFGRRPVLLTSLLGSGLDYLVLAFAPSLGWFFVGRVVSGITGASIGTAAAYIADVSPPHERGKNFGLIGMSFGLGFIAGPLLSAVIGAHDIRWPFLAAAALSLANTLYGFFVLPESLTPENRRAFSWARANPVGTLKTLFRTDLVFGLSLAIFFSTLAQRGLESVWVLYTEHRYEWSVRQTGLSLGVVGLTAAIVQGGLVRRFMPTLGEARAIIFGVCVSMVSFVLYGLAPQGWMLYAILPFSALGGFAAPAAQGLMSKAMPPNEQGLLQGGLSSMQSITNVIGPLIATNLFALFIGPSAPMHLPGASFFAGALMLLISLAVSLRALKGHRPPSDRVG